MKKIICTKSENGCRECMVLDGDNNGVWVERISHDDGDEYYVWSFYLTNAEREEAMDYLREDGILPEYGLIDVVMDDDKLGISGFGTGPWFSVDDLLETCKDDEWLDESLEKIIRAWDEGYVILNEEPIEIEYDPLTGDPAFFFQGDIYHLAEFVRTHNNAWVSDDYPDFIHGIETVTYNPYYVEIIGNSVNVYRHI